MNLCDSDDDWICNRAGAWDWMSHFFPSPAPIGSNVPGLLLSSYDNVKSPVFSMESLPSVLSVFSMEPLPSALSFSVMTFDGDDFIFVNCFLTFLMRLGFESSLGTLSCCQQKTFYWKPGQVKMDLKKMENHKRVNVEHWLRLGTEMELDGARASPRRRASRPRSRNPPASMSFFPAIALLWCLRTPHPWPKKNRSITRIGFDIIGCNEWSNPRSIIQGSNPHQPSITDNQTLIPPGRPHSGLK